MKKNKKIKSFSKKDEKNRNKKIYIFKNKLEWLLPKDKIIRDLWKYTRRKKRINKN